MSTLRGLAFTALLLGLMTTPRLAADEAVDKAVGFLLERQNPDGSFVFQRPSPRYEYHEDFKIGSTAMAGLALLSARGMGPEIERTVNHLMTRQRSNGLFSRSAKRNIENGYVVQLFAEALLHHDAGARMVNVQAPALRRALFRAARALIRAQTRLGAWPYGENWAYQESATAVVVLDALYLSQLCGYPVPPSTYQRALAYLATRVYPEGGFLNGERERTPSPHMTQAVLSVLVPLRQHGEVAEWIASGADYVQRMHQDGYFGGWVFEPGDPEEDDLLDVKHMVGARRHLYGCYYLTLAAARGAVHEDLASTIRKVRPHLLRYRTSRDTWSSTAGEVASTSLAVLALTAPEKRLFMTRLRHIDWWY